MSALASWLKARVEALPTSVARPLAKAPFVLRLGPAYSLARRRIASWEALSKAAAVQQQWQLLARVAKGASREVAFYRRFYNERGFNPEMLNDPADWHAVPIVTKEDLQKVPLIERSKPQLGRLKCNTGGTSGAPLAFYVDRQAFAREWAHLHYLWESRGYRRQHLKLTLRGKHFAKNQPLRYNAVHNEYVVNSTADMDRVVAAVLDLPHRERIRWVHGYPSLVAEFASALESGAAGNICDFRAGLFGVLLGSEYPAAPYREKICRALSTNIVSWYGHSEMAILARETAEGVYESMPMYGFVEAVPVVGEDSWRLVVTSLHNSVHPFIRYDTGDRIIPLGGAHGTLAFSVSEGRVGDFVVDRAGKRHSLTAIIFGRHHPAFEDAVHIQVRDEGQGRLALLVTAKDAATSAERIMQGFCFDGLDFDWRVELITAPLRTAAGKIQLKVG